MVWSACDILWQIVWNIVVKSEATKQQSHSLHFQEAAVKAQDGGKDVGGGQAFERPSGGVSNCVQLPKL